MVQKPKETALEAYMLPLDLPLVVELGCKGNMIVETNGDEPESISQATLAVPGSVG